MIFHDTTLPGVLVVEPARREDSRGWFARVFCSREMGLRGLRTEFPQCNTSFNRRAGTLRGMHWQAAPFAEAKLVRCTRGRAWAVVVDLRADCASSQRWAAVELNAENGLAVYIPEGFAHGFLTLADDTELFYMMSMPFEPAAARGFRWDDPRVGISWPFAPTVLSERDRALPSFPENGTE